MSPLPPMRFTVAVVVALLLGLAAVKLLVAWLEPQMAFFPLAGVQRTPEAVSLPYADLRIPTQDGETLHGWWLEHPEPRAQVIYWHGNGGNLSLWLDVIAEIRRQGLSVLAVDYRGYGLSSGTPSEQGFYRDAAAAVRHFDTLRRPGVPVIYWGRSIGCPVAASSAGARPPDGLVLESPMSSVQSLLRSNPVMWVLSQLSSYRFDTSRLVAGYRGPLLVIHGDGDTIVPHREGRAVLAAATGAQAVLATIPGADHNDLHLVNPPLYWAAVNGFLETVRGLRR